MSAPLNLDAIRARLEAATAGPWECAASMNYRMALVIAHSGTEAESRICKIADYSDAEFIAHARADIPALLAEVTRLRAELAEEKRDAALAEKHWHRDQADLAFIVAERDWLSAVVERVRKMANEDDRMAWDAHQELVRLILVAAPTSAATPETRTS